MPYEHRTAYRHENGEVEGFIGNGGTKGAAKKDALDQINKKITQVNQGSDIRSVLVFFDKTNVVESPSRLTREELDTVQKDWRSGVRYT
jgi:hypothetical protein